MKTGGAGSQGGNGGNNYPFAGTSTAGGGGGSTGNGVNGIIKKAGNGGTGTANSITGSSVTYGGGGGGCVIVSTSSIVGSGGSGGGGNGGDGSSQVATVGTDGLGGGGGGNWGTGKDGGDGVVILRFLSAGTVTIESNVWSSQDGTNPDEEGVSTFGHSGSITGRGSRTVLDGQTVRFNINGTEYYQIDNNGDWIAPDNQKLYLGTAKDSSIYYDGTNLVINAQEVGSGNVNLSGNNLINLSNVSATVSDQDLLFNINDGGTDRTAIQIHGDEGSVSMPRQSLVYAYTTGTQIIANNTLTTIIFTTESKDTLAEYSTGTGIFTAKDAGTYAVTSQVTWQNIASTQPHRHYITTTGTGRTPTLYTWTSIGTNYWFFSSSFNGNVYVPAGGTIAVQVYQSSGANRNVVSTGTTQLTIAKIA